VEAVTVAEGNGELAAEVIGTATYLTLAMAQQTLTSRQAVATAVRAGVVPVVATTLHQAQSAVEK